MKRFIATILTLALMCSFVPAAFAAAYAENEAAQALYDLGLFQGTGNNADGTPNFDLDRAPTRAEAVTMLVRLLGKEEEAKAGNWTTPFTDVADWAKPYVGYAYTNGLTTGTSDTTFGGNNLVNADQYLTFVLRALGYESGKDFQWDKAIEFAAQDSVCNTPAYRRDVTTFCRGTLAEISLRALVAKRKNDDQTLSVAMGLTLLPAQKSLEGNWAGTNCELQIDADTYSRAYLNESKDNDSYFESGEYALNGTNITLNSSTTYFLYQQGGIPFSDVKWTADPQSSHYSILLSKDGNELIELHGATFDRYKRVANAPMCEKAKVAKANYVPHSPNQVEIILLNTDFDDPELIDTLMTHYESSYSEPIDSVWKMSNFHYDSVVNYDKTCTVTIYISGEWLKDKFGGNVSGTKSCGIEWQLYDENQEYVINSGKIYSPKVYAGGKFKDASGVIFHVPVGTYYLLLS